MVIVTSSFATTAVFSHGFENKALLLK